MSAFARRCCRAAARYRQNYDKRTLNIPKYSTSEANAIQKAGSEFDMFWSGGDGAAVRELLAESGRTVQFSRDEKGVVDFFHAGGNSRMYGDDPMQQDHISSGYSFVRMWMEARFGRKPEGFMRWFKKKIGKIIAAAPRVRRSKTLEECVRQP